MQRLITGWSAASEQFSCRGYSSRCSWPYSPTQTTSAQPSSSISSHPAQQAASNSRVAAPRAGSGGLVHSVEQLLHQLKHGVGKDIWEVAVKRNGMTTSLALLGGVLVADMLLYRPKQRQTMMQANLAAPNSSSAQQQPDVAHSSSSSSTHGEVVAPRLTPPGVMPAHA